MTATGIPTPSPALAPVDKPLEPDDCKSWVAVEVLEGTDAAEGTCGVLVAVFVTDVNAIVVGPAEAWENTERSELCQRIGTPSIGTNVSEVALLITESCGPYPPAPKLGNR